jgi:hypothetical protein
LERYGLREERDDDDGEIAARFESIGLASRMEGGSRTKGGSGGGAEVEMGQRGGGGGGEVKLPRASTAPEEDNEDDDDDDDDVSTAVGRCRLNPVDP